MTIYRSTIPSAVPVGDIVDNGDGTFSASVFGEDAALGPYASDQAALKALVINQGCTAGFYTDPSPTALKMFLQ